MGASGDVNLGLQFFRVYEFISWGVRVVHDCHARSGKGHLCCHAVFPFAAWALDMFLEQPGKHQLGVELTCGINICEPVIHVC